MELILAALADAIIGLLIEDLAQRPGLSGLRDRLRGDSPEKLALHRALVGAYAAFQARYSGLTESFFDGHFLHKPEVKAELAKVLTVNQTPDKKRLADLWRSQFWSGQPRTNLDEPVNFFLEQFSEEVKAQPLLKPFVDSQAFQQLYRIAEGVQQQVEAQRQMVELLAEIREILSKPQGAPEPEPYRPGDISAVFAPTPAAIFDRPDKLIGRNDLLAEVNHALDKGENVLLCGFGGMGKTALAATVAADRIAAGKGPALWLRLGSSEADALLEALARPFGTDAARAVAVAQGDQKLAVVQQIIGQSGARLLVLDDAWNDKALLRLLKVARGLLPALVTSRQRYPIDGAAHQVDELSPDAALDTLTFYAGQALTPGPAPGGRGEPVAARDDAETLCRTLGFHAYALEIAGRTLKADGIAPGELLQRIAGVPHDLEMPLLFAEAGRESVARLIQASLDALDDEARRAFLAFGALFAPTATPELLNLYMSDSVGAQRAAPLPPAETASAAPPLHEMGRGLGGGVEASLTTLTRRGLAERLPAANNTATAYRVHDLAYSFARARSADDLARGLDACLAYTERHKSPSLPNFAALRPLLDNFLSAARWALDTERYAEVEEFAWNLYVGSESTGGIIERQGLSTQAITGNGRKVSDAEVILNSLRVAYHLPYDHYPITLLGWAARAAEQPGDKRDQGAHLGNLGNAYADLGQYQQAIEHYTQALAISRDIGDRRGEGNRLGSLGNAYYSLGQYQQAIEYYTQTLAISREIGDRQGEGNALGSLGLAYTSLGQYQQAIEHYTQALAIRREIGDRRGEGADLGNLGSAYKNLGQYDKAIEYHTQALAIRREIGDRRGEGNDLGNLGIAYADLGQYQQAIEYHTQALAISRDIGDRRGEGSDLGNLGNAYYSLGQYDKAIDYHQQALAITREIGNRNGEAIKLHGLGADYYGLGEYARAIDYYQQARAIFEAIGALHLVEHVDRNIARAQAAMEQKPP